MKLVLVIAAIIGLTAAAPAPAPQDLAEDLGRILAVLPWSEWDAIAKDHLENDPEFNEVIRYLQGPEWADIVSAVANLPEWLELKQWLTDAGLPVQAIIDAIHDFLAGVTPGPGAGEGSLRGFLDEIEAAVPLLDLLAVIVDLQENSPDFQGLVEKLKSETTHQLVEAVRAIPEVQRIAQRLEEMGVRVQEVLALIYAWAGWGEPKVQPRDLAEDLGRILAVLPWAEWDAIAKDHLENDPEFNEVIRYLQGPEWAEIVSAVANLPEWLELKQWLTDAGLPVQAIIDAIHDFLAGVTPGPGAGEGSLRGFLDEIEAAVPLLDLLAVIVDLQENSPDFQGLVEKLKSETTHQLVEAVRAIPEVQRIAQRLEEMGVRVQEVLALIYAWAGWGEPKVQPRDLAEDLGRILAVLPWAEWDAIAKDHLENDPEFNEVIRYLQGPEWAEIVSAVANLPEWLELKQWLTDAGLPVQAIIDAIHDFLAGVTPGPGAGEGSLRGFLDEIEAAVPLLDLLAVIVDLQENSPDFQGLVEKLKSETTHQLVEAVRAIPEVQRIAQRLEEMGVRVQEVLALIYAWAGWGEPKVQPRDLAEDLGRILAVLPWAEWDAIAKDHLENDPEFNEVIRYLQGPEWAEIVSAVANLPEWLELKQWLTDAGLPVQAIIDAIHDFLAGVTPGPGAGEGSLRGFLDEIEAAVPLLDLLAVIVDLQENSPDFQGLVEKLKSETTHQLVEAVRAIPEVQRIAQRLEEMGVRVQEVLALIYAWAGWGEPKVQPRDLAEDLGRILAVLPWAEWDAIAKDHLENDPEFNEVIRYLQGPEWAEIVSAVANLPEWLELKQWLTDAGLPVQAILDAIHDFLAGVTPGPGAGEGSLRGFLDEIEAAVPLLDLLAVIVDLQENSPDFQGLVEKLKSETTHQLVEAVRAIPEVQRIAQRLEEMGVRVQEVLALIYAWAGWGEPIYVN